MRTSRRIRGAVNWANLSTPAGLALVRLGAASVARGPDDLWIAYGYRLPLPAAPAFTVGSVVLVRRQLPPGADPVAAIPTRMLAHEDRHVTQYALCGGILMPLAYFAAAGWSWIRTGDWASRNAFERDAGLAAGGYRERPVRPLVEARAELRRAVAGTAPAQRLRMARTG